MKKRFYSMIKMFLIFGVLSGLVFSDSVSAEEEKEVLDHIASSDVYFSGYMLAVGDEEGWEETQCSIYDNMSYLVAYNDNAEAILIASEPDWDSVDIYTAGIYGLDFTMELCEEDAPYCELDSSIQNVVIPVCVSDPEEFELFPARTTEQQHVVYFLPDIPSEETEIYGFFSPEQCNLGELENCDWFLCGTDTACMKSNGFSISCAALEENYYSYFYLQYGDMSSQIVEIYENGEYTTVVGMGGDRDGGDADIINNPVVTQPAPTVPVKTTTTAVSTEKAVVSDIPVDKSAVIQENKKSVRNNKTAGEQDEEDTYPVADSSPSGTTVSEKKTSGQTPQTTVTDLSKGDSQQIEYSDNTKDELSGYRVRLMMEQSGGTAKFSKNGITISIPENAIEFADSDMITVSVQPVDDSSAYEIMILINDEQAEIKVPVTIWFPERCFSGTETPALEICGSTQLLEYDAESCAYRIETTYLGTYSLKSADSETGETAQESYLVRNMFLIIGAGIVLAGGAVFCICFLRRKVKG